MEVLLPAARVVDVRLLHRQVTAVEVARLINALIQHCHVVFFVDTIEYLEHSGRLSLATA